MTFERGTLVCGVMHEHSLVVELLDAIEERLAGLLVSTPERVVVERVDVQFGRLSGVEPGLLESAFEVLAPVRLGPRCQLVLDEVSLQAVCEACLHQFEPDGWNLFCPNCGSGETQIVAGDQLVLRRLWLVTEADATGSGDVHGIHAVGGG